MRELGKIHGRSGMVILTMPKKEIEKVIEPELPWSLHKNGGWRRQLERAKRWYKKLEKIYASQGENMRWEEAMDIVYAFFQNCYHLRDYILNSKAFSKTSVDRLFLENPEMQICQDICNGTKHYQLRRPRRKREFSMALEYVPESWPDRRFQANEKLVILSEGKKYDLFEVANRCLALWEEFTDKLEASTK